MSLIDLTIVRKTVRLIRSPYDWSKETPMSQQAGLPGGLSPDARGDLV